MSKNEKKIKTQLRQSRAFFLALIAVFSIWLISNMSERKTYREEYVICFDGVDTARYAVTQHDRVIALDINCNGFHTFRRNVKGLPTVHIDISKEMKKHKDESFPISLDINQLMDIIKDQIDLESSDNVEPVTQNLHLNIAKRVGKPFIPRIDAVEFQFEGMHGLCGNPTVTPDTVWLFGSKESLDKVTELQATKQTIKHIFRSGKYKVRLEPIWKKYPDLRPSAEKIEIFVPVETFIEKRVTTPVEFVSDEDVNRINIYPPKVTVTLLVPSNEYSTLNEKDILVTVSMESDSCSTLTPSVIKFPSNVRVKAIDPPIVRYTMIK